MRSNNLYKSVPMNIWGKNEYKKANGTQLTIEPLAASESV